MLYHAIAHINLRLGYLKGQRNYDQYDISFPSFISATPKIEVACGYIGHKNCGTIIKIDIENGTNKDQMGGDDELDVLPKFYPLSLFCADVSWISKFHNECEYLMPPTFLDYKKVQYSAPVKYRDQKHKCFFIETSHFKRVQR